MVRPPSGTAGQAMVKPQPSACISASVTGPMLPLGVESKVEQNLKWICRAPACLSQASAASDWATASAGGMVRDFSATTTASTASASGASGMPMVWMVRMPPRTSMLARSVAPVKSSAMQPSSMGASSTLRQVDAGEDLDHRGIVLAAVACGGGHQEHLVRGGGQRQGKRRSLACLQHDPQVLDEDVHRRARQVVAGDDVRRPVLEHPRVAGAVGDHVVEHLRVGAGLDAERHRLG